MTKGYTLEVVDRKNKRSDCYNFRTLEELELERNSNHKNDFCIVTEWAQYKGGFGDYEIEIARYNW